MRTILSFLILGIPMLLHAQHSSFELFDCESDDPKITLKAAEYTRVVDTFNRSIRLYENGSLLTINTHDVKQLRCYITLPRIGDNFSLIIEKKALEEGNNWEEISRNNYADKQQTPNYIFSEVISNTAETLGKVQIRFRLAYPPQNGSGNLYIDNISISKLSDVEVAEMRHQRDAAQRIKDIRKELNFVGQANCKSIAENYKILQKEYLDGLEKISMIAYRASMIELISEISLYTGQRGQMGNPITYNEFQLIIDSISMHADSLGKSLLKDFSQQMDSLLIKRFGGQQNRQNVFGKIFSIASNVANVITAGRIDNIVNSIKSMVATIFNRPALENKYLIRDLLENKRKKLDDRLEEMENLVNQQLQKGFQHITQLNDFLSVAQQENEDFLNELNSSSVILQAASELSGDVDKFIQDYLRDVNIVFQEDLESVYAKMNQTSSVFKDSLEQRIKGYFKNKMPNCDQVQTLSLHHSDLIILEQLNSNILELELVYSRYLSLIDQLKNHYQAQENTICNRKNPFDLQKYPKSHKKYEGLRNEACEKLKKVNLHLKKLLPEE